MRARAFAPLHLSSPAVGRLCIVALCALMSIVNLYATHGLDTSSATSRSGVDSVIFQSCALSARSATLEWNQWPPSSAIRTFAVTVEHSPAVR